MRKRNKIVIQSEQIREKKGEIKYIFENLCFINLRFNLSIKQPCYLAEKDAAQINTETILHRQTDST